MSTETTATPPAIARPDVPRPSAESGHFFDEVRLFHVASAAIVIIFTLFIWPNARDGQYLIAIFCSAGALGVAGNWILYRASGRLTRSMAFFCVICLLFTLAVFRQGSVYAFWLFLGPPGVFFLLGLQQGRRVVALFLLSVTILCLADGQLIEVGITRDYQLRIMASLIVLSLLSYAYEATREEAILSMRRTLDAQVAAEEALTAQARNHRILLDAIPDLIFHKDPGGAYVSANAAFFEFCGCSPEQVLGRTDTDIFAGDRCSALSLGDETVLINGRTELLEVALSDPAGRVLLFETVKTSIKDTSGTVAGVVGIYRDITHNRAAETALKAANEQLAQRARELEQSRRVALSIMEDTEKARCKADTLNRHLEEATRVATVLAQRAEEASKAKSDFLANMSHEIRTPMNVVIGMLDLLTGSELSGDQHDLVEMAGKNADSLLGLINDILDFSKIEAGRLDLEKIAFDPRQVLEDVGDMLAVTAQEKGLELICFVDETVPDKVVGDPVRLRQVLVNLGGNAVKFTEKGEVQLRVLLLDTTNGNYELRFEVSDTGIGIATAKRETLFESFTQSDASTTRKFGGTGLGLAISRQLVEMMQGRIDLQSRLGRGSLFWFTAFFGVAGRTPAETGPHLLLQGRRLLILSDHAAAGWVAAAYLEAAGALCRRIGSKDEALPALAEAAARGAPFQTVVVDLRVPLAELHALGRKIAADPACGQPRLVALCPAGRQADIAATNNNPYFCSLTRPVKKAPLLSCVDEIKDRAAKPDGHAEPDRQPGKLAAPPVPPPSTIPARAGLNILLVEDNAMNRKVAVRMLEKLGHRVTVAENGRQAVETFTAAVTDTPIDAILMDGQMPEMDGILATRAIRALEAERGSPHPIPIIAITANAMKGDKERFLAAGMDGYIAKPMKQIDIATQLDKLTPARTTPTDPTLTNHPGDHPANHPDDPVDIDELLDIMDNDHHLLAECFHEFLKSHQGQLQAIKAAIAAGDGAELDRCAHRLKGNLKYIAARLATQTASALEQSGRDGRLAGTETLLLQLTKECEAVKRFIEDFERNNSILHRRG